MHSTTVPIPFGIHVLLGSIMAFAAGCGDNSTPVSPVDQGVGACIDDYTPSYGTDILESTDEKVQGVLCRWEVFPLNVYFEDDSMWTQSLEDNCGSGFDVWAMATEGATSWQKVTDVDQAQVTVRFVPHGGLGSGTYGATALSLYVETRGLVRADMRIAEAGDTASMQQTCAHEFGHALGIGGHSPDSTDLMFYAQRNTTPSFPTERDMNTLMGIYCGTF